MRGELIREKLRRGERVYGTHVCSLMNPRAAQMATEIEADFVFFCNEHMPLDRSETAWMCQLYAAQGISPIVRIPNTQPHWAAMAVDGGAQGIVVPYVETPQEVREIVGAVKYRPIKGRLLQDFLEGRRRPSPKTLDFLNGFNRDQYVIIGVESVEAASRLEELIGAGGVDGVFLGPHDLTVSMEIPAEYDHPAFLDLLEDVVRRSRAAGVGVGVHYTWPMLKAEGIRRLVRAGMNWILNAGDVTVMRDALNGQLAEVRAIFGDRYERHGPPDAKAAPLHPLEEAPRIRTPGKPRTS